MTMTKINGEIVRDYETGKIYLKFTESNERDTSEGVEKSSEDYIFELDSQKDLTRLIRYFGYKSDEFEDSRHSKIGNLYVLTGGGRKNEDDDRILTEYEKQIGIAYN